MDRLTFRKWWHLRGGTLPHDATKREVAVLAWSAACEAQSLSQEAARNEALSALEDGYAVLADITNQWEGRHTLAGQKLLCKMRDAIADATGRSAEDVQDNPAALKREPNAAAPGASE